MRYNISHGDADEYTIVAKTSLQSITGIRLEVLTHDSLPMKGPGRQDNGNLHLSEFRVKINGIDAPIAKATADFNQDGWDIAKAIDGNKATAWGIYPEVGKPHQAVFEFKKPIEPGREREYRTGAWIAGPDPGSDR